MPGNSQRKGAVRKRGKGVGSTGNTAGSGGRVKRGLEGKGPTPKAEDRPYHKAYRKRRPGESPISNDTPRGRRTVPGEQRVRQTSAKAPGADWIIGRNPVLEALQADLPVRRAYIMEGAERDSRITEILKLAAEKGVTLLRASRSELDRLTAGAVHQGVAFQMPEYEYAHPGDLLEEVLADSDAPIMVACDSITDPRNLGAIIRSAAAFGARGVIVPERRSAHMTAASWKTSAGAAARVPVALATNLNRVLRDYAEAGFVVVGLAGEGEVDIADIPGVEGPVLLVIGSEREGLAQLVRKNCDVLASIPIASDVESLNASVAASIALYEVARARD
ncbi:23S rRNA (guanosine(2251)-2'-O)-methyltransferase RlmB [Propioniciclava sinopodophylli]|uniref:23S rRNA (Guanosine(2251)-2'-O)-methyltransferase RlmB n=1 Tax=Propioniciclava sinopodophylli TaxID=1837344 RepID=A0A4Q9KGR2_9ACTN|nr:23S rRNA (guanosine(2251)-2'-O)-methyltransferase RlmB [Propioniciclava sinopodophylli]TBT88451.1 23S rRNA (guanosine(2251)-2'-O)-methyltransferase RlmB [Propioniciclava sinopodophylli]